MRRKLQWCSKKEKKIVVIFFCLLLLMILISIYNIVNKGIIVISLIPMFFVPAFLVAWRNYKEIKNEMILRKIND